MQQRRAAFLHLGETVTDLVGFIVGQTAAEVGVAPGEGLAPGGGNQDFVLLHSEYALVGAHDLSHRLLQLWIRRQKQVCESLKGFRCQGGGLGPPVSTVCICVCALVPLTGAREGLRLSR